MTYNLKVAKIPIGIKYLEIDDTAHCVGGNANSSHEAVTCDNSVFTNQLLLF
jgi:hypothetical protein